ncbi:hypothetical protein BGW80DRAFT_1322198 [Lactifluus volemus]|nr:hypothetical protein BGW80DRAFT_1322198 [Lactifluus volemus]
MILSLFAAALLAPPVNAFWRLPCAKPVLNARVDPIIAPGGPSSHLHTIMGSNAIGYSTTFGDLRNCQCSTCKVKDDKSAYWIPQLYYQYPNGSLVEVSHGGMIVYYIQRGGSNETIEAFPDGLHMFTGDPYARSYPGTTESQVINWLCLGPNGPIGDQTPGIGNTNCPYGLRAQVFFPGCWDGVNLDSPDHKSHMAFPSELNDGFCPPSHPHHLVSLYYEVYFYVTPFNSGNYGGQFVLANGDPTGYGLHADFLNGWDRNVLTRAIQTCTASSGVIEQCSVFANEGRFYSDAEMNACSASNPIPSESVPGALHQYLPGCVPVTKGPGRASPTDRAPGCVVSANRRSEPEEELEECDEVEERAEEDDFETSTSLRDRWHRALRGDWSFPSM